MKARDIVFAIIAAAIIVLVVSFLAHAQEAPDVTLGIQMAPIRSSVVINQEGQPEVDFNSLFNQNPTQAALTAVVRCRMYDSIEGRARITPSLSREGIAPLNGPFYVNNINFGAEPQQGGTGGSAGTSQTKFAKIQYDWSVNEYEAAFTAINQQNMRLQPVFGYKCYTFNLTASGKGKSTQDSVETANTRKSIPEIGLQAEFAKAPWSLNLQFMKDINSNGGSIRGTIGYLPNIFPMTFHLGYEAEKTVMDLPGLSETRVQWSGFLLVGEYRF